ncbi:olfactory receptor 5F1-like isoform X1 [Crotalus tigris]|uniref:olfactory receptor 5F1-like isoform X1 n=2 Tax=Crotalus tigris TaxID=88082 RepID=UPI00192F633B|nr:olfactory receptor 5F1-like isoform X1 [Crotalus tigris]
MECCSYLVFIIIIILNKCLIITLEGTRRSISILHEHHKSNSETEMSIKNHTAVSEFILLGFAENPKLKVPIFIFFLLIYSITVVTNLGMIFLIGMDTQLHTPMYFFLSNLAFIDFCYSSNIIPKALGNFLAEKKTISFTGCIIQIYFFVALASTEIILFGLMAFDRYVAICNPLLYPSLMSHAQCLKMAGGAFTAGFLNSIIHTSLVGTLSFCQSNEINHFFCEIPQLLKLSCSKTFLTEILIFVCAGINMLGSLLIILSSYIHILCTIFKMNSVVGRQKAFSTCISHLTAVIIFYGTGLFIYLQPSSNYSEDQNKTVSLFYAFIIPMLNPLIYSLRNKEVKDSLKRTMDRNLFPLLK